MIQRSALAATALSVLTVLGASSCSSAPAASTSAGGPATTPSATSSTTSPPSTTFAPVSLTAGQQRVSAANQKLTASLFVLAGDGRTMKFANELATGRKAIAAATAHLRASLSAERTAAYGSTTHNCAGVRANLGGAAAARSQVDAAAASLDAVAARMRGSVATLQKQMATVNADFAALRAALAAEPHPPAVLGSTEVQAALSGSQSLAASTLQAASDTVSKDAAAVGSASQMVASGDTIATKSGC